MENLIIYGFKFFSLFGLLRFLQIKCLSGIFQFFY